MSIVGQLSAPGIQMLNFTLTFDGKIPSGNKGSHVKEKQEIRRALHPQLQAWWETGPLAATWREIPTGSTMWEQYIRSRQAVESGFTYLPLVTKFLEVACELDILLLKPEDPGRFVRNDGDLDNRLKILFDALRMPLDRGEIPAGDSPEDNERPYFYCLLEDDNLITKVTLQADRLLALRPDPDAVRLIISVAIRATHLTRLNFPFGT